MISNNILLSITNISKKHCRQGGMATSEWTRCVRAVTDTPVADHSVPGVAEIPDQEIAHGSFRRKLRKWRFRFEECREGVAAAR